MNIAQSLQHTCALGLERLDAQLLLLAALGRPGHDRTWLLAHDTDSVPPEVLTRLQTTAQRRLAHEPLAYITGYKEFYGLNLCVDPRVLDPRADTETLVDWALEVLAHDPLDSAVRSVLDLGTGSGAIALALKNVRPDLQVHALDNSAQALTVARANAQRLGLTVQFHQGAWLAGLPHGANGVPGRLHAIVSNPPYIAATDPHLAHLTHEPLQALASGADGLDDIRTIIHQAPGHLHPGGWLLLEHGYDQADAVAALLRKSGFSNVQSRHDLAGIARCSGGNLQAF
jgi:release factor glutamine methyltransferase